MPFVIMHPLATLVTVSLPLHSDEFLCQYTSVRQRMEIPSPCHHSCCCVCNIYYGVRVDHYGVRVDHYGVRVDHYGVRVDHYGVRVDHYGVRADHYGVQVHHQIRTENCP